MRLGSMDPMESIRQALPRCLQQMQPEILPRLLPIPRTTNTRLHHRNDHRRPFDEMALPDPHASSERRPAVDHNRQAPKSLPQTPTTRVLEEAHPRRNRRARNEDRRQQQTMAHPPAHPHARPIHATTPTQTRMALLHANIDDHRHTPGQPTVSRGRVHNKVPDETPAK